MVFHELSHGSRGRLKEQRGVWLQSQYLEASILLTRRWRAYCAMEL